ncbi:MAG: hypothetical protein M1503_03705 [Thaumarchaeota archaeon]|nr:hypothetical protein [Nitrososphaerota archaeon]MCL5317359.1 hypothetical protein [Nitrososphaerota archaeon]
MVLPGRVHSSIAQVINGDARHVTIGIDMNTKQILWRVFSFPPQDKPTKDWALQECSTGFFRDTPCSEVAQVNQKGLEWDWALPDKPPIKYAGVTSNWGQPVIDEDTGILYTQTGNQGPYSNLTLSPGPRLYGSTIMAIDMNSGKRIWWLQPFPHDPYDYDCNWGGILAETKSIGKVYMKGCKEGVFYVMDAATGKPKYTVDVRKDQLARGQISSLSIQAYAPDPKSYHDMREYNWISYPAAKPGDKGEHFTLPAPVYPAWMNGIFQTDMSFDPDGQRIILYEGALQTTVLQEYTWEAGGNLFSTKDNPVTNTSIVARDLSTGKVVWSWFYKYSQQRAAMAVSGGMVFTGFTDNYLRFFDKDTGKLLHEMAIGAPTVVGVTIGKDADQNSKIFIIAGKTGIFGAGMAGQASVPGTLIAIGLSDKSAGAVQTTTVTTTAAATTITSTATTTTTSISTSVSTSITTSATTQTVTTTSATTATTTLAPQTQTTTVTSSAPAQTTTVVSSVTQTTGLPSEVTYAAIGVAVVALIAAAVLAMRKRA